MHADNAKHFFDRRSSAFIGGSTSYGILTTVKFRSETVSAALPTFA
jgi:hypothetical protein